MHFNKHHRLWFLDIVVSQMWWIIVDVVNPDIRTMLISRHYCWWKNSLPEKICRYIGRGRPRSCGGYTYKSMQEVKFWNVFVLDFFLPAQFNFFIAQSVAPDIHYIDVIMTLMASQITSPTVVYSIVYSDADQRKHQSSESLAFVRGSHQDQWIPRTKGQ